MSTRDKHRMLLLSGRLGDGHKQAALALQETVSLVSSDVDVAHCDFLEWTHPYTHEVSRYLYLQWVKKFPSLYGYLFRKTKYDSSLSVVFKKIRLFKLARMMQLLNEASPSVVVSTFPSAAAAMSVLKMNGLTNVPTVTVITDHTDHSYWIHPMTDRYIVGSEPVREALIRQGVPRSRIEVTGIPVRPQFYEHYDRAELCRKHGLNETMRTVLVTGGGFGLLSEDIKELLVDRLYNVPVQFIVVCGHNRKLRESMEAVSAHSPHRVKVTGFVDHIHELMAISDIILTKPGGLTTSEAVAQSLPMIFFQALPGQEQDNARILTEAGVARDAKQKGSLYRTLNDLIADPGALLAMKEKARRFGNSKAAESAIRVILRTAQGSAVYTSQELSLVGGGM